MPLAIICWLAIDFVVLGKYSFVYTGDNLTVIIPALLSFGWTGLSDWNPWSSAGWDSLAIAPIGIGNVLLFSVLPGWAAYSVNIVVQVVAAVLGVYVLARRIGLAWPAAAFCGFAFALNVSGQLHLASVNFIPVVILATSLVVARPGNWVRWLGLCTVIAVLVSTGWIGELVPFVAFPVITWFLFVERTRQCRSWLIIAATALFTMLPRLPELYTLAAYSTLSHRALVKTVPTLANLFDMPAKFFSDINHLLLLALAAFAVTAFRHSPAFKRLLIGFGVWIALIIVSVPAEMLIYDVLPILQGYNFNRLIHSPSLLLVFAGGFGFQALLDGRGDRLNPLMRNLAILGVVTFTFALSCNQKFDNAYAWISQGNWVANLESPQLIRLADRIRAEGSDARVETLQIYPSYLHAYGIATAGGLHAMFSRRYYEFWSELVEPWIASWPDDYAGFGRASDEVYRDTGIWPRFRGPILMLYSSDHKSETRLGDLARLDFLSLASVAWIVSRDRLTDPSLTLLEGPERGWNERSTAEKIRAAFSANFEGKTDFYIYRNQNAFPRVFAVDQVEAFEDGRKVLMAMARATPERLRRVAFVEPKNRPAGEVFPTQITHISRTSDTIRIAVQGNGPMFVVIGDSYSPFWTCRGDHGDVRVVPANHAFTGLIADSGTTLIDCVYKRPMLRDWVYGTTAR